MDARKGFEDTDNCGFFITGQFVIVRLGAYARILLSASRPAWMVSSETA
jgi:hypothetical protein